MDNQNKNLIMASLLSILVLVGWSYFFPQPEIAPDLSGPGQTQPVEDPNGLVPSASEGARPATPADTVDTTIQPTTASDAGRIPINTPELTGSISLYGGRIDELQLKSYRETNIAGSDIVTLFSPEENAGAYYALYGWAPAGDLDQSHVPGPQTIWEIEGNPELSITTPITLKWDNGAGLVFRRNVAIDDKFMFIVTQSVENTGGNNVRLAPYGVLRRHGEPEDLKGFFILHEGAIRQSGEEMSELSYKDLRRLDPDTTWGAAAEVVSADQNGWIGFTDHYWMTTLIPAANQSFDAIFKYYESSETYTAWTQLETIEVAAGESTSATTQLFAGAKEWETIREYENQGGVYRFIDSIDWGWFFFVTKPMFALLHWLNGIIDNMGWSIIVLTVIVKAALLPLAYKSYVSMAKMKELQPEMEELKKRAGDDKQMLQKEMMALYKKEKVNPASGCLPIFLQIPIFFSLYKVIFVTLELRHAPWLGWIQDLSAPDPSSILNLFGLLAFAPPEQGSFLAIISLGVMPILLGISMWLQQKLNPAPSDPTQQMIFAWMPWVFMFMLGQFASGLVLYWITSNTLTFMQQYTIMRSHGHKPDVFGNILKGFRKKPKDDT